MHSTPPAFQAFQYAMARHLRDPHHTPRPSGVPARRMAVYNELLFNNLCGFLDSCFPVCRRLLGEERWRRLNRAFYRDGPLHTPLQREIPCEFTRYLARRAGPPLPAWLPELAHYEWAELAVDLLEVTPPAHDPGGDLLQGTVLLNPAHMNLGYQWPVQRIGPDWRPRRPQPTQLLVWRDATDTVQFMQLNPVTARLLALLATEPLTGEAACRRIAAELKHPDPERLLAHGAALLEQLRGQGILLGTLT